MILLDRIKALILCVLTVCLSGCVSDDDPEGESLVAAGDAVPAFTVTLSDGSTFTSPADFGSREGNTVIVLFNTDCPDCRAELERLQGAPHDNVICISRQEGEAAVSAYWREHGLTLTYAAVPDRSVYSLFATAGIPRTYIVSPEGRIVSVR